MDNMQQTIDWDIEKRPLTDAANGNPIPGWSRIAKNTDIILNQEAVDNDGAEPILGNPTFHIAKNSYNPPTTEEFQQYYHELAEMTGFKPQGFQEWRDGMRIFGYLKNEGEKFDIDGHQIDDYLLIGVGYGGNTSFFIGSVNQLLRCENQFGLINRTWKIRNSSGRQLKTHELLQGFKEHMQVRDNMFETFRRFKDVKIDHDLIVAAKRRIMEMEDEEKVADLGTRRKNQYEALTAALIGETQDLGNNLWGLFNGVTKFTTHSLVSGNEKKNIFGNVVGGENRHKKNRLAYELCKDYAENEAGILLPN